MQNNTLGKFKNLRPLQLTSSFQKKKKKKGLLQSVSKLSFFNYNVSIDALYIGLYKVQSHTMP